MTRDRPYLLPEPTPVVCESGEPLASVESILVDRYDRGVIAALNVVDPMCVDHGAAERDCWIELGSRGVARGLLLAGWTPPPVVNPDDVTDGDEVEGCASGPSAGPSAP